MQAMGLTFHLIATQVALIDSMKLIVLAKGESCLFGGSAAAFSCCKM
jgi:hypothetical protein